MPAIVPYHVNVEPFACLDDKQLDAVLEQMNVEQQYIVSRQDDRCNELIQFKWLTSLSTFLLSEGLMSHSADINFHHFLKAIHLHIYTLFVCDLPMEKWRQLKDLVFLHVHTLDLKLNHSNEDLQNMTDNPETELEPRNRSMSTHFNDNDLGVLSAMFPYLKKLKLCACAISGLSLGNFPFLESLTLEDITTIPPGGFSIFLGKLTQLRKFDIMLNRQVHRKDLRDIKTCKTLEYIRLADCHFIMLPLLYNDLLAMPKMQTIAVLITHSIDSTLGTMVANATRRAEEFVYCGPITNPTFFFYHIAKLYDLRKLVVECTERFPPLHVSYAQLEQISCNMPNLRELHLINCCIEDCRGLATFIDNCPSLELIDVTHCSNLNANCIRLCLETLNGYDSRAQTLELWIKESIPRDVLETKMSEDVNNLLKIDTDKSIRGRQQADVLKIKFFPSC